MSNKDVKTITRSIAEEVVQRSALIDQAKELVKNEISNHESLKVSEDEKSGVIVITGVKYGRAVIELNDWFEKINHNYLPESIARDMMEEVHNQLVPGIEQTLL